MTRSKLPKRHAPQPAAVGAECRRGGHGQCSKLNCVCACHYDLEVEPSERCDGLKELTDL